MILTNQFGPLFRREAYAVNLALMENMELENPFSSIIPETGIEGIWDKEYSVVPIGELSGRKEAEDIPEKNMTMGYTAYGAIATEATGKVALSKHMQEFSRKFHSEDEEKFAGYLADTVARAFLSRKMTKWHKLQADLFNLGGIQAGNAFFNQRERAEGLSDIPDSNLIYDGSPLFALPAAAHPSYAASTTVGPGSAAVGTSVDFAATITDTGGYFNAFQYPPSYWGLKRVWQHFIFNMPYDENDVKFYSRPDTLLVSSFNLPKWTEILQSKFIAGTTENTENIFMMDGYRVKIIDSPFLIPNTWYMGKALSPGIKRYRPSVADEPFAYYREENNRSYFISYDAEWGFIVRNWRYWVGGSIATDGATAPSYGVESTWETIPAGV